MKFQLILTGSQLMALRTILVSNIASPDGITTHVDCSQDPAVETKPEDLLTLTMNARAVEEPFGPEWVRRKEEESERGFGRKS